MPARDAVATPAPESDPVPEPESAPDPEPEPEPDPDPVPEPVEQRTSSSDLSDLLSQLGDGTDGFVADGTPLTDPRDLERPDDPARVVVESTGAINYQPEFASFGARAGGVVIDTLVSTLALIPGVVLTVTGSGIVRLLGVLVVLAGVALVAWSYTRSITRTGQWIGNRMMSTTVVQVSNGEFLDAPRAFTRFVARSVVSPVFLAGFAMALTNTSRRTFHDQIADSIVTRPTRASWSIDDESDATG